MSASQSIKLTVHMNFNFDVSNIFDKTKEKQVTVLMNVRVYKNIVDSINFFHSK